MILEIEEIDKISLHPIYGIVEYYGRIQIHHQWYVYDPVQDRLLRSPNLPSQQELFDATTQRH